MVGVDLVRAGVMPGHGACRGRAGREWRIAGLPDAEGGVIVEKAGNYRRVTGTTGKDGLREIRVDAAATPLIATITP